MHAEKIKLATKVRSFLEINGLLGHAIQDQCQSDPSGCCEGQGGCPYCYYSGLTPLDPPIDYIKDAMNCHFLFRNDNPDFVEGLSNNCICNICEGSNWDGPPSNPQCDRCKNLENGSGIDGRVINNEEFDEKTSSPKRLLQELKTCIQCPLLGNTERGFWDEDLQNGGANPRWRECLGGGNTDLKACPCQYQDNICSNGYSTPDGGGGTPGSDDACRDDPFPTTDPRSFDPANMDICNLSCRCTMADCSEPPSGGEYTKCECRGNSTAPAQCAFGKGCTDYSRNFVGPDNDEFPAGQGVPPAIKTAHGNCWGLICPDTPTTPTSERILSNKDQCGRDCDPSDNNPLTGLDQMRLPTYLLQCDKDSDCSRYNAYCCPTGLCGTSDEMCYENIYVSRNAHNELPPNMDGI
jgi:hypothetical protein